jgi:DNA invertase Pin-like site-specific DNA recombinase
VLDRAYIDLTSPTGRGFMAFISAMAEDERLRIIKRLTKVAPSPAKTA